MEDNHNFLLNISVLYRNIQKYFDHVLAPYEIGAGQVIILMVINENTGITMQEVSQLCEIDKGTCTKSVNRLIDQGYVQMRVDEKDRRIRRLYTTDRAADIVRKLYDFRNQYRHFLSRNADFDMFEKELDVICDNARNSLEEEREETHIRIGNFEKLDLNDNSNGLCARVEMSGCSWKCPYCNRRNLVYIPENTGYVSPEEVIAYLKKRKGMLDEVTISGGEPLMQTGLRNFLKMIKKEGYRVRLETCGNRSELLKEYCEDGLIDFVSMDIKNCPDKYAETAGMDKDTFSVHNVEESVAYLKQGNVPYELVTTVLRNYHSLDDLLALATWIGPVDNYYLQQFRPSDTVIRQGLEAYTLEEVMEMKKEIQKIIPNVRLRGF